MASDFFNHLIIAHILGNVTKADISLLIRGDEQTSADAKLRILAALEHSNADSIAATFERDEINTGKEQWIDKFKVDKRPIAAKGQTVKELAKETSTKKDDISEKLETIFKLLEDRLSKLENK